MTTKHYSSCVYADGVRRTAVVLTVPVCFLVGDTTKASSSMAVAAGRTSSWCDGFAAGGGCDGGCDGETARRPGADVRDAGRRARSRVGRARVSQPTGTGRRRRAGARGTGGGTYLRGYSRTAVHRVVGAACGRPGVRTGVRGSGRAGGRAGGCSKTSGRGLRDEWRRVPRSAAYLSGP